MDGTRTKEKVTIAATVDRMRQAVETVSFLPIRPTDMSLSSHYANAQFGQSTIIQGSLSK